LDVSVERVHDPTDYLSIRCTLRYRDHSYARAGVLATEPANRSLFASGSSHGSCLGGPKCQRSWHDQLAAWVICAAGSRSLTCIQRKHSVLPVCSLGIWARSCRWSVAWAILLAGLSKLGPDLSLAPSSQSARWFV